jgi:hypothetical protein
MAEDGGIAHGLPSQFQIVDIGEVEVLGDEDTDLLALVLFQHRPDVDVVLERDRGPRSARVTLLKLPLPLDAACPAI